MSQLETIFHFFDLKNFVDLGKYIMFAKNNKCYIIIVI